MALNAHGSLNFDTPARARNLRIPRLSAEDSDSEFEEASPCRPRNHSLFTHGNHALQDVSSRANVQANYKRLDLNLGDFVADLTEGCHISTAKPKWKGDHVTPATHAGRASSLPYPPQLFRNVESPMTAIRSATSSSSSLQTTLESPFGSPVAVPKENPFDTFKPNNASGDLGPTASGASLVSPVCTELDSEFGTEIETDADSESEPETEAEQDMFAKYRRQQLQVPLAKAQQQHRQADRFQSFKQHNPSIHHNVFMPAASTAVSASQQARETSTPIFRPQYMHHAANKSAIGISFTMNEDLNEESDDYSNDTGTSPAPAPRAARASFNRTQIWMPPTKVRRTQSMFATPEQLLHEQLGQIERPMNHLGQPADTFTGILGSPSCPLRTYAVKQDPFKRIDHNTLCQLLDGEFSDTFSEVIVIDCRFEYEYEGGHISGALNVNSKQQLEEVLFRQRSCGFDRSVLLVFHCEHSAYRSPLLVSHLRQSDRHLNAPHYPKLFYPDVVVLDGGYSEFYATFSHRCHPQNYIGMDHQEHRETCEREMSKFRSGMRARKMPTFNTGGSTPNLLDFRFPKPSPALRSASVADLNDPNSKQCDANVFGF